MFNFHLDISKNEVINITQDIVKWITIYIVIHFLTYAIDNEGDLLNEKVLKKLLYITIAMIIYNLTTKRFLVPKKNEK